jgi:hypothetical protein
MSVLLYWRERLEAHNPLYKEDLRIPGLNVRPMNGMDPKASWPRAIARYALYQDYCIWHREQFLPLYKGVECPTPKPADELIFYSTMAEWLYIVGKEQQVRTYLVTHSSYYEGEWVRGRKHRYFIRLLDWAYHAAQFELTTGIFCFNDDMLAEDRIRLIESAKSDYTAVLDHNRNKFGSVQPASDDDAS